MGLSQFAAWMKSIGFPERIAIEQLFFAFDEDGGGSISFAECVVGLSFVLVRDIRLPQYEMTIEGSPEFLDIAFRFLDREKRGVLTKMGICKVMIAGLKMSARAASELGQQLLDIASDKQPQFVHILENTPELWRFMRRLLQIQNKARHTAEFKQGKQRALRHFDNVLNNRDEGDCPNVEEVDYDALDNVLPVYVDPRANIMSALTKVTRLPRRTSEVIQTMDLTTDQRAQIELLSNQLAEDKAS